MRGRRRGNSILKHPVSLSNVFKHSCKAPKGSRNSDLQLRNPEIHIQWASSTPANLLETAWRAHSSSQYFHNTRCKLHPAF